jgi:hypothetical protein
MNIDKNKFVNRKLEKKGVVSPCHERLCSDQELYYKRKENGVHLQFDCIPDKVFFPWVNIVHLIDGLESKYNFNWAEPVSLTFHSVML